MRGQTDGQFAITTEVEARVYDEIEPFSLEDLDEADQQEILAKLPFTERIRLRRSLDYPEDTAGRRFLALEVAASSAGFASKN